MARLPDLRPAAVLAAATLAAGSTSVHAQLFQQQTSSRFPTQAEYTNQATFGDLDDDGDLDIVFANGQGYSSLGSLLKPRIYMNDGTGHFTDETDARAAGVLGCFRGVELGDIDRDGDLDMVLAQDFFRKPKLLLNDGTGVFTEVSERLPDLNLSSARGQFGDVDDDGDLDLVFNHSGTSSRFGSNGAPKLYLNDGTGHFTDASATHIPTAIVPDQQDILFFDMDNDLDLDLHIGSRSSSGGGSQIWRNDGTGHFERISGVPTDFSTYSYDAGDIDGDGDLDLIGANADSGNKEMLLRNYAGDGSIWQKISSRISPNPSSDDNDTKFFDIDDDGDLDLIVGALYGSRERIYVNDSGFFVEDTSLITPQSDATLDVMVGDLTGDGRVDIVTGQGEGGSFQNRIYVNVGGAVDSRAPRVVAMDLVEPGESLGPFRVRALLADDLTSDRGFFARGVELRYAIDGGKAQSIEMQWSGNNLYRATIPAQAECVEVAYRVVAEDWAGNVGEGELATFTTTGCGGNPADLDGDGSVTGADLTILLAAWGTKGGAADLDGDGSVGGADLTLLLAAWE